MFSAKSFNKVTMVLVMLLISSIIISTFADVRSDFHIQLEFERLLSDVDEFNELHAAFLLDNEQEDIAPAQLKYETSEEALVAAYENYYNAESYYYENSGRLTAKVIGYPIKIDFWIKAALYLNGDYFQEVIAKEVGTTFGGKKGAFGLFYSAETNTVYRVFSWNVEEINGTWCSDFIPASWGRQTIEDYTEEFGGPPNSSIYEVNTRTAVKENYYNTIKVPGTNQITEYHVNYELNAILSTKMYLGFLSYTLDFVEEGFLRSLSFKTLDVSAIIDNEGYLKTARYNETYNFTVYVKMAGIQATAVCTSKMTYNFMLFNQPIPLERPGIKVFNEDIEALNQPEITE
jgi:hypothetical protein